MGQKKRSAAGPEGAARCSEVGCNLPVWEEAPRRGLCAGHYQWHRRHTPGFIREPLPQWLGRNGGGAVSGGRFMRVLVALSLAWGCTAREALQRVEGGGR